MRSQSFHDRTRESREDNVRHVVKSQPADGRQLEATLVTLAAREGERRHALPVDMVAVTNQRTSGRIRPIADEDMAVGGAEEAVALEAAGIAAIVAQSETLEVTAREPAGGHMNQHVNLLVRLWA